MVEMTEAANILQNASPCSLVILDEIGRGTSTYDGISIAWAMAEWLYHHNRSLALFATHYHELTELAKRHDGIHNASIAVKKWKNEIIFLRKLIDEPANRSYGIEVAKLAGLPPAVIERAQQLLSALEQKDAARRQLIETARQGDDDSIAVNDEDVAVVDAFGDASLTTSHANRRRQRELFANNELAESEGTSRDFDSEHAIYGDLARAVEGIVLDTMTPIQALNWLYRWQRKLKK